MADASPRPAFDALVEVLYSTPRDCGWNLLVRRLARAILTHEGVSAVLAAAEEAGLVERFDHVEQSLGRDGGGAVDVDS